MTDIDMEYTISEKPVASHDEVFTAKQAYEYLKISRPTFVKLFKEGRIRGTTTGKNRRVLRSECDRWARGET